MNEWEKSLKNITAFIFDYDGVMTDGTVYMDSNGDPLRTSNVKDGYALQLASKLGYHVAVISGAVVTNITKRLNMCLQASPTKWSNWRHLWANTA